MRGENMSGSSRALEVGEGREPETELSAFSSDDASPTEWASARAHVEAAEVFWLSTVRPDGRPHVTPLLAVWSDDALYFCTSPPERKAKNLEQTPTASSRLGATASTDSTSSSKAKPERSATNSSSAASPTPTQPSTRAISPNPTAPGSDSTTPSAPGTRCCTAWRQ